MRTHLIMVKFRKQKLVAKGNVFDESGRWGSTLIYIPQITFSTVTTQTLQLALQYVNLGHSDLFVFKAYESFSQHNIHTSGAL